MEGNERPGSSLPPDVAVMFEHALERMNAGAGTWELWLRAESGHVRKYRLTEEGGRDQLARFNENAEPE